MMTAIMQQIWGILEVQMRPQLVLIIESDYHKVSSGRPLTEMRAKELLECCQVSMRRALEEAYDRKLVTAQAQQNVATAARARLKKELDAEFPIVVLA